MADVNQIEQAKSQWQRYGNEYVDLESHLRSSATLRGDSDPQTVAIGLKLHEAKQNRDTFKAAYDTLAGVTYTQKEKLEQCYGQVRTLSDKRQALKLGRFIALSALAKQDDSNSRQLMQRRAQEYRSEYGYNPMEQSDNVEVRALSEIVATAGGYLVPQELAIEIIRLVTQYGVIRKAFKSYTMSSDSLSIPIRKSGNSAYWVMDNTAITGSDMKFGSAKLTAETLATYSVYSLQLNDDALINLGDLYAQESVLSLAYTEDYTGFLGDGTSAWGGFTGLSKAYADVANNPSIYTSAVTGHSGSFASLTAADVSAWMGTLPMYDGGKWGFWCSNGFYENVFGRIMLEGGGNTIATIYQGIGDTNGPVMQRSFRGYPVYISNVLPQTGAVNQYSAYFGDMSQVAAIGERGQIAVAASNVAGNLFQNLQIGIRVFERLGFSVHSVGGTTDPGGNTVASPLIAYKMAAS